MTTWYTLYLVVEDEALKQHPRYNFTLSMNENLNAGFDLVTAEDFVGKPGEPHLLNLGVKAMMVRENTNEAVHYWLAPRSSIYKTGHIMANSMGVIDNTYRGTLKAPVVALTEGASGFKAGDRHFQIVAPDMGWISEVRTVRSLPESERGEAGFGSTGR
jgi:deoxyuridine 5'-triphosphate nucleotidohydrolase